MEGKDTSRLILTKLDIPGVYQFKVTASTVDGLRQGVGFVNVTVKPAPRVNHAPRAEIQPKDVQLQLPTNEAILDGSSKFTILIFILIFSHKIQYQPHLSVAVPSPGKCFHVH